MFNSSVTQAVDVIHLLGFVKKACNSASYCFKLRIEQVLSGQIEGEVSVFYDGNSRIFDPENYELLLSKSNIVEGSHLRLMLHPSSAGYYASFIWIGD